MNSVPVNKQLIEDRIKEIKDDIQKLSSYKMKSLDEFKEGENFAICEHYLRRALQAFIDIATHILSRLPGPKPAGYKEAALLLGEKGIVPLNFAKEKLVKMAGYRNRLIHFYNEITKEELHSIIQLDLSDLEDFCRHILDYLSAQG